MSVQSRRGSAAIRQVLKEVINIEQLPSKRFEHIEKAKLGEVVAFLEKKIDRQHSEIKVLSEQLSREITLKEELLLSLNQEREKNARLAQHLAVANRSSHQLKFRMEKSKAENSQCEKEDYEAKINKYREIVRKKDELLTKNQQKLEQLLKNERSINSLELQLKSLKESYGKLKSREENQTVEIEKLRQKILDATDKLKGKEEILQKTETNLKEKQSRVLFADEHLCRIKAEYNNLLKDHEEAIEASRLAEENTRRLLEQQAEEIKKLTQRNPEPFDTQMAKWDLGVFKKELRRLLQGVIREPNLRKKVEKEMTELLSDVEASFTHVLTKFFSQP